jgi:transposase-like protein
MKKRQFTLSFKLLVIRYYEQNGKNLSRTAKEYVVDRKTIRNWIASKEAIKATNTKNLRNKVKRKPDKVEYPEMEAELHGWVKSVRANGGCINDKQIKHKALQIMSRNKSFAASTGWLMRFLHRKRLSLRRITTKGRKPPKNMKKIVQDFLAENETFHATDRNLIFNMDETAIYLDSPSKFLRSQL